MLDEDVTRLIEEEMSRHRKPFKEVVNEALRRGLARRARGSSQPRYKVRPHKTTLRPLDGASFDRLVDELDDEAGIAKTTAR